MMVGVLLAGGASRRMGSPKALKRSSGASFLAHGVRHLWTACDAVVVVLGADAARVRRNIEEEFERLVSTGRLRDDLAQAHRHGAPGLEVRFVVNRAWRRGMLSSARAGLKTALALKPEVVMVLPVDHPAIQPRTCAALALLMHAAVAAYRSTHGKRQRFAYALIPRYRRRRGHPVALTPRLAREIAADRGARDLSDAVRRNARLVGYMDCPDPGVVRNRNTPRD
jgi:CTP:molybdopterin cytidylyltransferase MocA